MRPEPPPRTTPPAPGGPVATPTGTGPRPPRPPRRPSEVARAVTAQLRAALADAAPTSGYQRALYLGGLVLLGSAVVHAAVWLVDGSAWDGAVSWRKPMTFGFSFGLLLLSCGWIQGTLPRSRAWGWSVTVLVAGGSLLEVGLITVQRWRGVPSHFNDATPLDALVFTVMAAAIGTALLGVVVLGVWAALRLRGPAPVVVAVAVGLTVTMVGGAIGGDMIARGLELTETHGTVPGVVLVGAAGSAKLAHAVSLHGLQVLGLLALLLGRSGLTPRGRARAMLAAAGGYTALTALVVAQAYAGRALTDLPVATAVGLALAATAVVVPFVLAVRDAGARPVPLRLTADDDREGTHAHRL
ncbi:hypothetical protein AB6N24_14385 [Cellulomonas sp. 179-A 4D5 NHS]|uniref:hypothetical protein n=1 Tax=Cellulomonas sp. 179-A 4D5 NHS TaxID=3142378 RepID=UPI00399FE745